MKNFNIAVMVLLITGCNNGKNLPEPPVQKDSVSNTSTTSVDTAPGFSLGVFDKNKTLKLDIGLKKHLKFLGF